MKSAFYMYWGILRGKKSSCGMISYSMILFFFLRRNHKAIQWVYINLNAEKKVGKSRLQTALSGNLWGGDWEKDSAHKSLDR